jgi:Tol biopolymer transport system component
MAGISLGGALASRGSSSLSLVGVASIVACAVVLAGGGVLLLALRLHSGHMAARQARAQAAVLAHETEEMGRKVHPLHGSAEAVDPNRVLRFPRALVVSSRQTGNWEIFLVSPDNGDVKNLTNHAAADTAPDCSPDGQKIAFVSDRDGTQNIWVMNVNGTGLRQLTRESTPAVSPCWSPDGQKIVFVCSRDGTENLWVMDADGDNVKQLTAEKVPNRRPAWSPDGQKITCERHLAGGLVETFVMDADGSNPTNLSRGGGVDAAWSPDGKRIAFTSKRGGPHSRPYVMDADGNNVRLLSNNGNPPGNVSPAWSPDGNRIAFTDFIAGAAQIAVCDADGSKRATLTAQGGSSLARWSPDGQTIAYMHGEANKRVALWVMDADGKNPREVLHGVGWFAWRPK